MSTCVLMCLKVGGWPNMPYGTWAKACRWQRKNFAPTLPFAPQLDQDNPLRWQLYLLSELSWGGRHDLWQSVSPTVVHGGAWPEWWLDSLSPYTWLENLTSFKNMSEIDWSRIDLERIFNGISSNNLICLSPLNRIKKVFYVHLGLLENKTNNIHLEKI